MPAELTFTADRAGAAALLLPDLQPVDAGLQRSGPRHALHIRPAATPRGLFRRRPLTPSIAIFRGEDGDYGVVLRSLAPMLPGSLSADLAAAGFRAPFGWILRVDLSNTCGWKVSGAVADERLIDGAVRALAALPGRAGVAAEYHAALALDSPAAAHQR